MSVFVYSNKKAAEKQFRQPEHSTVPFETSRRLSDLRQTTIL